MMLLSDNFWWLPWTAVVVRIIMKVSHQYVPHAYFSTSILLAMKHSIISVLWMKLKLGWILHLTLSCMTWTCSMATARQLASTGSSSTCSSTFCKIKIKWTAWSCQTSAKDQSETYLPLCTILTTGDKNAWDDFIRYFPVWIWHVRRKRRSCSVCSGVWVWGANHLAVLLVCFDLTS